MQLPAAHLHPDVILVLGAVWGAYLWAWKARSRSIPLDMDPNRRKLVTRFSLGMLVLFIASNWPMHDLAETRLYSFHMIQHMAYQLVAAPLLILGMPAWMWRSMLRPAWLMSLWKRMTRPVAAFATFNLVLLVTHWPAVVELSVSNELFHFALHVLVVTSAVIMWWPILSPLPEAPPIVPPLQMMYLFLQSLAPTIPASFLTFGEDPLYKVYATFPRIWGVSALSDMRVAGLIMKVAGGLILWTYITVIFFRWYFDEQKREGLDGAPVGDALKAT